MSEDVARAIGAGNGDDDIIIAGKRCTVRPLTIKELTEIEAQCLKRYKRNALETYSENLDLLPEEDRKKAIRDKLEETSKWDVKDLPTRLAYDVDRVVVTPALQEWVQKNFDIGLNEPDEKKLKKVIQRAVVTCLDNGTLTPEVYEHLTGSLPRSAKIGYVNWWVTATFEGQIEMLFGCFKHNGITRDELLAEFTTNPLLIINISREIEHLTAPQLGKPPGA